MIIKTMIRKLGFFMVIPGILLVGTLYALGYKSLTLINSSSFYGLTPTSHFIDFLYFSLITVTTTGYGDIYPLTKTAKILASTEIILGLLLVFSIVVSAVVRDRKLKVGKKS